MLGLGPQPGPGAQPEGFSWSYEDDLPLEHPAIGYWREGGVDAVARLARRVESGAARLELHPELSYLPSLLDALDIDVESQALVFSKTSLLRALISPRTPRAIYFNDEVAVGFVPGAQTIELAATDPERGVLFYTLDAREPMTPRFTRPRLCLECHQGPATLGIPGVYVGSLYTSPSGRPDFRLGSIVSDHRTPFEERWGGWFVHLQGTSGIDAHRGNTVSGDPGFATFLSPEAGLAPRVDPSRYPSPWSDVVALMTLEHQTQMTNLLARLSWEARLAESEADLDARVEETLRYLLFADEVPLRGPVRGPSRFAETFSMRGPRDGRGRSLRDFDLERRLFRYPLSYMVYSDAFEALPGRVRERLYRRLWEVLTGDATDAGFDRLSRDDRRAILAILRETKPGLPDFFRPVAQ